MSREPKKENFLIALLKELWKLMLLLLLAAFLYFHPFDLSLEDKLLLIALGLLGGISWVIGKAEESLHKHLDEINAKLDVLLEYQELKHEPLDSDSDSW